MTVDYADTLHFIRHFRFVFVLHSYIHFYLLQVANVLLVSEMISVLLCVCVYMLVSFSVRKKICLNV